MQSQNVLIIPASSPNISGFSPLPRIKHEIQAIQKHHNAEVLSEPVSRMDLLRRVTNDPRIDIMHFAGHLSADGFISGHEIIPISTLVMCIITAEPDLVVFATCSSEAVAEMVASQCASDCLYTIYNIEDSAAVDFAVLFYAALIKDEITSYPEAHKQIDPTGVLFRYLEGKDLVIRRGDQIATRLVALEEVIGGKLGSVGLFQRVIQIEIDLVEIKKNQKVEPTTAINPNLLLGTVFIALILLFLTLLWKF